jgi:hypothetical protein
MPKGRRDHLGDLGVWVWTGFKWIRIVRADFCENNNEILVTQKWEIS